VRSRAVTTEKKKRRPSERLQDNRHGEWARWRDNEFVVVTRWGGDHHGETAARLANGGL